MAAMGQQDAFQARLARIGKTGGGPAVLLAGIDDVPTQQRATRNVKRKPLFSLKNLMSYPIAFAVGAIAMLAGHVLTYRFIDEVGRAEDALGVTKLMAIDIGLAATITLVVLLFFGFVKKPHFLLAALGFGVIITQEIELARQFPDVWAQIYSPGFVQQSLRAGELLLPDVAVTYTLG
ncbi:hypothetical protein N4R57_09185 [Rhodobacteraceae bacterium D3-12]|nr:hypothetical protein N4R57_09185 [Rhodobacteraceae bacterium D3-12]